MPEEFSSILAFLAAMLPGALYVWAYERQAGRWGIGLSDRVLRFVGGSAIFHALFAPLTYWFVADRWPLIRGGSPVSLLTWVLPIGYVAVPVAAGDTLGRAVRRGVPWATWLTGPKRVPRAWDYLFHDDLDGWVRLKLKSGVWIGGAFVDENGRRSYAAAYPEPQDLFVAAAVATDPDSGEFLLTDDGDIEVLPFGLLVRWDEVEYLEFVDATVGDLGGDREGDREGQPQGRSSDEDPELEEDA